MVSVLSAGQEVALCQRSPVPSNHLEEDVFLFEEIHVKQHLLGSF